MLGGADDRLRTAGRTLRRLQLNGVHQAPTTTRVVSERDERSSEDNIPVTLIATSLIGTANRARSGNKSIRQEAIARLAEKLILGLLLNESSCLDLLEDILSDTGLISTLVSVIVTKE